MTIACSLKLIWSLPCGQPYQNVVLLKIILILIMKITLQVYALFYFVLVALIQAKELKYFSNFKPGNIVYGQESLMTDYVTVANDPVSNLPDRFSICTSVFVGNMTTGKSVVQIYKENGLPWFQLGIGTSRDLTTRTEILDLYSQTELKRVQKYPKLVPIVPHSCYHVCLGLDTVSGLLRITVNGILIENETKEFLKNTSSIKPNSVSETISGKLFFLFPLKC